MGYTRMHMEKYVNEYGPPELISAEEIKELDSKAVFLPIEKDRKMAYYEYGVPEGFPIIFFHGTGSHVHVMLLHKPAIKHGFRIIVPDRPGIGRTDFKKKWTLLEYVDDIKKLADHLGLNKFIVMGISGGGPIQSGDLDIVPEARVKWLYDYLGEAMETSSTFTGGGSSFSTEGFKPAKNMVDFGGTISMIKGSTTLALGYDFGTKEDYYSHNGTVTVKYQF